MKINSDKSLFKRLQLCTLWAVFILSCTMIFTGCKPDKKRIEAEQIVKEWLGKKILFPENSKCSVQRKDTTIAFCKGLFDTEFKVLLYADSAGCSDCRLKLFEWENLIAESDSLFHGKLNFLFFFQPKNSNSRDLEFIIHKNRFDYPVFFDVNNKLDRLNHFPKDVSFQCFLLDKNNKVLMIGNPILNSKIWKLYKEQITGKNQVDSMLHTTVEPNKMVHDYGSIKKGIKNRAEFLIKNTGSQPLVLYRVSASCGCTEVEWEKQPIKSGMYAKVKVELTPEETGFFNKTLDVYGNMELSPLTLKITGNAVD